jgi:2-polyprenyl-3-methyl-5-hydroxy-6-metoxy-1,4-benzoquinol methylase
MSEGNWQNGDRVDETRTQKARTRTQKEIEVSRMTPETSRLDQGYSLALSDVERARYRLMAERAFTTEADIWHRAGIVSGARVADIGCGPGALLPALAEAVGRTGSVVGVDADPDAVRAARAYVESCSLDNVTVQPGRADVTGLGDETVDVVMMRHVLAHNGGREDDIVGHLAGLVRPGGSVYLVDIDMMSMDMSPPDADIAELNDRYVAWHTARGNDLRAGTRLAARLSTAGLVVEEEQTIPGSFPVPPGLRSPAWAAREALRDVGLASAEDIARWQAAFERLDAAEVRPILTVSTLLAYGRKPAR